MRVDVRHNFGDVAKRLGQLADDVRDKALARTLNKVTEGARGRMATEIAAEFMITKREANDNLRTDRATFKAGKFYLEARLYSPSNGKRRGFNLIRFVRGRRVKGGKGSPELKFKIRRSGGTVTVKGAFIGNQGRTVFQRVGSKRLPIKGLATIDVPQMFNTKRVNQRVREYIAQRLSIVLEQEIKFVTRTR